ncbi:MAG: FTR1 family protein [Alphaproteobacteria bacterium]|nr:FTR1 family protein [Alphaproteobacteria bacterium]
MIAALLIVSREVLEAALIVGVVAAATAGVPRRGSWIAGGIAAGVGGATLVAGFAGAIAAALEGIGQELFNAAVLFAATLMLGWHNVWMSRHGREMAAEAGTLGRAVRAGSRPLYALALIVGLAVLREGSEIVLFLYGIAIGGGGGAWAMAAGSALGLAAGAAAGAALYFGLVRLPLRLLFAVTSWLVLLVAAGMAAQAAAFLVQADLVPPLGDAVWDSSFLLREASLPGQVLHALAGYTARPEGIQLLVYAATIVTIGGLMRLFAPPPAGRSAPGAAGLRAG